MQQQHHGPVGALEPGLEHVHFQAIDSGYMA